MSAPRRIWTASFYWFGVVMAIAGTALMLSGHTVSGYRLEYDAFPLWWACAGLAVLSFVAAEICNPGASRPEPRPRSSARSMHANAPPAEGAVHLPAAER